MPARLRNSPKFNLSKLREFTTNEVEFLLNRMAIPLFLFCASIGIVYGFINFVVHPTLVRLKGVPYTSSDVLEEIPKEPAFYFFAAGLVGVCVVLRWWMLVNLRRNFQNILTGNDKDRLSALDWNVVQGLKERALALRTRADLILGAGFALLLAGTYFVLFILQEVVGTDPFRVAQAQFVQTFSDRLNCVFDGKCWTKVESLATVNGEMSVLRSGSAFNNFDAKGEWRISTRKLQNIDGSTWRIEQELTLAPGERVTAVALSADGTIGVVGTSEGSLFMTINGGEEWIRQPIRQSPRESVVAATLAADGRTGLVGSSDGSVFLRRIGAGGWNRVKLEGMERQRVTAVGLSADGTTGIVGGDEGSVFVTNNRGGSWSRQTVELSRGEWVEVATLSADGKTSILLGDEGSILRTTAGRSGWTSQNLTLTVPRAVEYAALGTDGTTAIMASSRGSVFMTTDGGDIWSSANLNLTRRNEVVDVALSADGTTGIVVTRTGGVFVTTDSGNSWDQQTIDLKPSEAVTAVAFGKDNTIGTVATIAGSVTITKDGGASWRKADNTELEPQRDQVSAATLNMNDTTGIVASTSGSVFMTKDGGGTWNRRSIELRPSEWAISAGFNADGTVGIVAGDEGSVFTTTDAGESWTSPPNMKLDPQDAIRRVAFSSDDTGIAESSDGSIFILKKYPQMEKWTEWSPVLTLILRNMAEDRILGKSEIYQEITTFVAESTAVTAPGNQGVPGDEEGTITRLLGELNVLRGVTLAVVFFLVQILVRLHQYSLRLAAFCDSRADAMLLARSFASGRAVKFDDLVVALAPDAYDFKPPPRPPFDWLRARSNI